MTKVKKNVASTTPGMPFSKAQNKHITRKAKQGYLTKPFHVGPSKLFCLGKTHFVVRRIKVGRRSPFRPFREPRMGERNGSWRRKAIRVFFFSGLHLFFLVWGAVLLRCSCLIHRFTVTETTIQSNGIEDTKYNGIVMSNYGSFLGGFLCKIM